MTRSRRRRSNGESDQPTHVGAVGELRIGAELLGGPIRRAFLDADKDRTPSDVAALIQSSVERARQLGVSPSLIALPAGAGTLQRNRISSRWWTAEARATTQTDAERFAEDLQRLLGPSHPSVVLGVDQEVIFAKRRGRQSFWEQLLSRVERGEPAHVSWKCTPVGADEENSLYIRWSKGRQAPDEGAVSENGAIGSVGGKTALFLVCHDGTAFARTRWLPRARPGSWRVITRQQYGDLVVQHTPVIAFNALHRLPGHTESRQIPSPFLNGHKNLAAGVLPLPREKREISPVPVVAVSGLHPGCGVDPFDNVRQRLPCPFAHLDVRIQPGV